MSGLSADIALVTGVVIATLNYGAARFAYLTMLLRAEGRKDAAREREAAVIETALQAGMRARKPASAPDPSPQPAPRTALTTRGPGRRKSRPARPPSARVPGRPQ